MCLIFSGDCLVFFAMLKSCVVPPALLNSGSATAHNNKRVRRISERKTEYF